MPRLMADPAVLHDEGAEFIAYHWSSQCPDEMREYDYGDPVFESEVQFAESLAAYLVSQCPELGPGTDAFERIKAHARGECKIACGVEHHVPATSGVEPVTRSGLRAKGAIFDVSDRYEQIGNTPAPVETDVLIGDRTIRVCLNSPALIAITGEGEFSIERARVWIKRGKLPVFNEGKKTDLRTTRQMLVDWFTDKKAALDPLARYETRNPVLYRTLRGKQQRAAEWRHNQKVRDNTEAEDALLKAEIARRKAARQEKFADTLPVERAP